MKNLKLFGVLIIVLVTHSAFGQRITIEQYISMYKDLAMAEMQRTGVPASITLAQGILETENGNSELVKKSNNHFGIKCKEDWTGPTVSHTDDAPWECFRKYSSAEESYRDHSNFLRTRKYYASLFNIDPMDYKAWAYGLKKAGYATNPQYAQQLINYIETYNLQQYSLIAMGKMPKQDEMFAKTESTVQPVAQTTATMKNETNTAVVTKEPVQEKAIKTIPDAPAVVAESENTTTVAAAPAKKKAVYPSGIFKINETKVIYAAKGTSLLAIAEQNAIPLNYLLDFNDLKNKDILEDGQLIYLQRKRRQGNGEAHIVKEDETLYDIAQAEGIRLEALLQYNLLSNPSQLIEPGEKLNLQGMASQAPKLKTAMAVNNISANTVSSTSLPKIHKVEPKETIYSISRKYNIPVNQLMDWNKMKGYDVKIGQELIISK